MHNMRKKKSIAARTAKYLKISVKLHQELQRIYIMAFLKGCTKRKEPRVHQVPLYLKKIKKKEKGK